MMNNQYSRKVAVLVSLIVLVLSVLSIHAADNWYILLYNEIQHELVQVNLLDSSVQSFELGVEPTTRVSGDRMGFSADGQRVAFCAETLEPGISVAQTTLVVRDVQSMNNVAQVDLGSTLGCHISNVAFSSDSSQVAVAIVRNPQDVPAADGRIWQLLVIDIASGQIIYDLNPTLAAVANSDLPVDQLILAEVRDFDESNVTFAGMPFGVGGIVYGDVYRWSLDYGSLERLAGGPRSNTSLLDTLPDVGEMVWLDEEPSLATIDTLPNPMGRFNIVLMSDASGDTSIIYHAENAVLASPTYVAGGEQLALMLHMPMSDATVPQNQWIALNREGAVTQLTRSAPILDLVDAPGGYIALTAGDIYTLSHHVLGSDTVNVLWQSEFDGWQIVWSSQYPAPMDLLPFVSIG